jgi:hypothetical protein
MLYAVSAIVHMQRTESPGLIDKTTAWKSSIPLPTFYLDSNVQGIMSEDHATRIVRTMLESIGHTDVSISCVETLTPVYNHVTRSR